MNKWLLVLMFLYSQMSARESLTGWYTGYREICKKAATDPQYLATFRSIPEFRLAFEITSGESFAQYVVASERLSSKIENFRLLETIGQPVLNYYPDLGNFSATSLRYICLADQIKKMVALPPNPVIAEIGAGFGGQCFMLSQLHPFAKYYFFDLPEVELLIRKVMDTLNVQNTYCIPMEEHLPEERIDLVISNYAFSECDREIQMEYFERIIKKADRGYMIYNQIIQDSGIDSLSLEEFVQLLRSIGLRPKTHKELLSTAPGNYVVIWNRSGK